MPNFAKIGFSNTTKAVAVISMVVLATACSSSDNPTKNTLSEQPLVTGAPKIARISGKGGTKIAVLVNKNPITTNQIKRRAAFVRLRRIKGNSTSIAKKELIEEAIKLQEARRIGSVVSEPEVTAAYARFAKSNKMQVNALTRMLSQSGVTQRGFKDYIRANMSWQRAVAVRLRSESSGNATGSAWLPAVGSASATEKEYTIQQIVFIVPAAKRKAILSRRRLEAKRFRNQLNGCSNARTLAVGLRDVTILDRGRLLESQLPQRWAKDIKATPAGKVTRVRDDANGVEMIAVCKTREVIGKAKGINGDLFSGKNFQESASALEKKYYGEIEKVAIIQRR